ncbi:phosphate system positive regulatory protein pho81 [Arachnomyces sp. PD_36]|nr:phosphate system positive regulatory protein pho81 [Arachnomyces sp. PD_36]
MADTQEDWGENTPPLIRAIINNDIAAIQNELNCGASANEFMPGDVSALDYAASEGNIEAVRLLLKHGAQAIDMDALGFCPIHYAVRGGNPAIVQLLIEDYGVDVETPTAGNGETPLMRVSSSVVNPVSCANMLFSHGAEVNAGDYGGRTALHYAAERGSDTVVDLLLARGADIQANNAQAQPLFDAVKGGNMKIVRTLLEAGSAINTRNSWGETPLHRAAFEGSIEIIKYLIDAGVETNAKSKTDATALHRAAEGGHKEIIQLLSGIGLEINARNTYGWTPLIFAARSGSISAVRMLLDHGADASGASCYGWTALHMASCSHDSDAMPHDTSILELLFQRGADIMACSSYFFNPGSAEEGEGFMERMHLDCDKDADRLITPLHCAVSSGQTLAAKLLIELGADIEARDKHSSTPLHSAAFHLFIPTIRLLLEKGANVSAVDGKGCTVIQVLLRSLGKDQTQRLLEPYGDFSPLIDAEIAATPGVLDRFNSKLPGRGRGRQLHIDFVI